MEKAGGRLEERDRKREREGMVKLTEELMGNGQAFETDPDQVLLLLRERKCLCFQVSDKGRKRGRCKGGNTNQYVQPIDVSRSIS